MVQESIGAAFKAWVPKYSNDADDVTCVSEDANKNGILTPVKMQTSTSS
ncbi:MAG: hypothetical protein U5L01_05570 [Rheinheimera sp.]|nr:hypothetical protein [Rheinheimera sp.]